MLSARRRFPLKDGNSSDEDGNGGSKSDEDGKEWPSLTWLAQESQPEVNVVLLVGLSVSSVGVHIDHSFAANMKQQP